MGDTKHLDAHDDDSNVKEAPDALRRERGGGPTHFGAYRHPTHFGAYRSSVRGRAVPATLHATGWQPDR